MESVTVREGWYKDIRSVVLRSGDVEAVVLPECGGKCASFKSLQSNREFLVQRPGTEYLRQPYDGTYVKGECSGFDDMFPTIDECYYPSYPWAGTRMPDHGEVWSLAGDSRIEDDALVMKLHGVRFPYTLEKRVFFLAPKVLCIDYSLLNRSPFELDFLWAAHIMVNIVEGTRILAPQGADRTVTVLSASGRMGGYGETRSWPAFTTPDGASHRADVARHASVRDMEKYYFTDPLTEGWCALEYASPAPAAGGTTLFGVSFSLKTVPYLGILLNENGWTNNGAWPELLNIFIEPCTAPMDRIDAAKLRGACSTVAARSSYRWRLCMAAEVAPEGYSLDRIDPDGMPLWRRADP